MATVVMSMFGYSYTYHDRAGDLGTDIYSGKNGRIAQKMKVWIYSGPRLGERG